MNKLGYITLNNLKKLLNNILLDQFLTVIIEMSLYITLCILKRNYDNVLFIWQWPVEWVKKQELIRKPITYREMT